MTAKKEEIRELLQQAKTIAVVGLSDKPDRDSYRVAEYLQNQGYRIIPVNPRVDQVLGEKAYASLTEVDESVDIVDVFRRSEHVMPIAEDAVKIGAKALWQQMGINNEEASRYAEENGLLSITNQCIKVVHSLL